MRKNDLILSVAVSIAVGGFFAIVVPGVLAGFLRLDSNWFWLAPGFGLLKPGRDDGVLIFWSLIISGLCYAAITWVIVFSFLNARRNKHP